MADFKTAYNKTAINEGGYANDPEDHGGETWKGVARKIFPSWPGWLIVDAAKRQPGFPKSLYAIEGLQDCVDSFYRTNFWNVIKGDQINVQEVANDIYDSAVNMGTGTAIQLVQNTLFDISGMFNERLLQAHKIGITYAVMDTKTLNTLNNKV